jgi:translation initiation factor 1A
MVINKKGGKKGKKGKRPSEQVERKIVFKEEFQEYCQVTKLLGNCRLEGNCFDGKTRQCNIRGSMRKKIWIKVGDIVIVSLREFEDNKCDIIYLYQPKEVKKLINSEKKPKLYETVVLNKK